MSERSLRDTRAGRRRRSSRRLRRIASLLANFPLVVAFSGGLGATLRIMFELWRARGLGSVAGWAVTAVAHSRFLNARRYAAWSRRRTPCAAGAGTMLIVCSTLGVAPETRTAFLRLLRPSRQPRVDMLVATDDAGRVAAERLPLPPSIPLETVSPLSIDAVLKLARERCERYDFVALPAPGCVVAEDLPAPAELGNDVLFYGDEDRIDAAGRRSRPFLKPGFSPDLLMADEYFGCVIVSRSLLRALPEQPVFDYHSLTLRLAEMASRTMHLDACVTHRFAAPTGRKSEHSPNTPMPTGQPARPPTHPPVTPPAYLPTYLANRYGSGTDVQPVSGTPPWRCSFGNAGALVSVIVPTRDRLALLRDCVEGIFATNRGRFEVLVLDNDSVAAETLAWFEEATARWPGLRVIAAPGEFNWSRLNNLGVEQATGDVFVFLNNDTVPRSEDWLARLADVAMRPDVGAVGALLLYPSGRIQHAGVVVGEGRWTDHIYRGDFPSGGDHVFVAPHLPRNVAAVTGACMAISRATIQRIGLFDENYAVAGNDVELCLRAMRHDLYNVYLPDVVLLHLESQTRGRRDPLPDVLRLEDYLSRHCATDPFFNRHLASAPLYFTQRSAP